MSNRANPFAPFDRRHVLFAMNPSDAPAPVETSTTLDLGNNETQKTGIFPACDGAFTAITLTASKSFRKHERAVKWLAARGYDANGAKLPRDGATS